MIGDERLHVGFHVGRDAQLLFEFLLGVPLKVEGDRPEGLRVHRGIIDRRRYKKHAGLKPGPTRRGAAM